MHSTMILKNKTMLLVCFIVTTLLNGLSCYAGTLEDGGRVYENPVLISPGIIFETQFFKASERFNFSESVRQKIPNSMYLLGVQVLYRFQQTSNDMPQGFSVDILHGAMDTHDQVNINGNLIDKIKLYRMRFFYNIMAFGVGVEYNNFQHTSLENQVLFIENKYNFVSKFDYGWFVWNREGISFLINLEFNDPKKKPVGQFGWCYTF